MCCSIKTECYEHNFRMYVICLKRKFILLCLINNICVLCPCNLLKSLNRVTSHICLRMYSF